MIPWRVAIFLLGLAPALFAQDAGAGFNTNMLGTWTPIFRGIEHTFGQSIVSGASNEVIHALRIDLQDPGVAFFTSPRFPGAPPEWGETAGQTTATFLRTFGVQVAVNANFFYPCCTGAEGSPVYLQGLAISQGDLVSTLRDPSFSTCLLLTTDNVPTIVWSNSPLPDLAGVFTAVTGNRPLLMGGTNVGENGPIHPRTAVGYSQDKRFLFLLTVDGRQLGYSDGCTDFDTAEWMRRCGAYDALNLDGGGSTTMAMSDGHGGSRLLNRPIHDGIPGNQRVCANHLGVFAAPLDPATGSDPCAAGGIALSRIAGGQVTSVTARATPRKLYSIQYTDNLGYGWNTLMMGTTDGSGSFQFLDAGGAAARFYRLACP